MKIHNGIDIIEKIKNSKNISKKYGIKFLKKFLPMMK